MKTLTKTLMKIPTKILTKASNLVLCTLCASLLLLAGCKAPVSTAASEPVQPAASAEQATSAEESADATGFDFSYSERDTDASYDESSATVINLAEPTASMGVSLSQETITLTEEGTYILRGSAKNLSVVIDVPDDVKVQVVLDGVDISNTTAPALLVEAADKVFVTLAPGSTNILSDGTGRTDLPATEEEEAELEAAGTEVNNATLYSHEDLTINGTGSLKVVSTSAHAIKSSDDLVITGGTFTIDAAVDGLRGKDCVKIADGSFTITAADDAIVSTNTDEPDTKGFVSIDGGTFTITAAGDAIHAETILRAASGTVNVLACEEGYEGAQVWIRGGEHSIASKDDGVNAAGDARSDYLIDITGGKLYVNAEGDGIDSNDTLTQSGGEVIVEGSTMSDNGALDAERSATISGGSMLALGAGGMEMSFGIGSTQASFLLNLPQALSAKTSISLVDSQGTELFSFATTKQYRSLVYSSPTLIQGDSYTLKANGESLVSFTLTELQAQISADGTVSAYAGGGGLGGMGGGPGGDMGRGMEGDPGTRPNGDMGGAFR